jgi:hypothetical protein
MAIIPFVERVIEFQTELGVIARAWRPYVVLEFTDTRGSTFRRAAVVDSGAPFSVLPFTLWNDKDLAWQFLGNQFLVGNRPDIAALTWQGVPCQFGETQVRLLDDQKGVRSALLTLRAKFPIAKAPSHMEKEALAGNSFLLDNFLTQAMRGGEDWLDGVFLVD